ncbi:MAG TPA: class I SAM-dependent methyltransferase [Terriglobia bacterium]|nr:class I SAM-dependent methyltransferase [Terriglobia bacterium]
MATQPQALPPDPATIFEALNSYQRSAALKAAIELEVFTGIGEGKADVESLAKRCEATERGIRILCDYLTIQGFLGKEDHRYSLTPTSAAFLDRRSPKYLGTIARFMDSPAHIARLQSLASIVRTGGSLIHEDGSADEGNAEWIEFARSIAPMMALPAELVAGLVGASAGVPWKVLDIAAGHGLYGITIARHNPNAEIVAVDWPQVLEVARENAQKAGVSARHRLLPGSAFDVDFGANYDLILLTNFLHHFDPPTNEKLLAKVHRALKPGGRAVTLEFVPNPDRVSPPIAAAFSLIMLSNTKAGDAYAFAELEAMFRNAGFARSELHPLPPTPQSVVMAYKEGG